jgi:hypothetical protein
VSLELLRSEEPEGLTVSTGLTTTTDHEGRWSFSLTLPPSGVYFTVVGRAIGVASRVVGVTAEVRAR